MLLASLLALGKAEASLPRPVCSLATQEGALWRPVPLWAPEGILPETRMHAHQC